MKAASLLISWKDEYDDLSTKEEIDALKDVFSSTFTYCKNTVARLKSPDNKSVTKLLSNFRNREEEEDKLLIVYYAGYGICEGWDKINPLFVFLLPVRGSHTDEVFLGLFVKSFLKSAFMIANPTFL
jgi:hypothetical protein